MERLFPPALSPGDTIAFVAPAGVVDMTRVDRAQQRLEAIGYRIKTYGDLARERGYLAGDDETRAAELMAAFCDPDVKAVFPVRGGYGCMRLLSRLDYGAIRQHPKIFLGFSDNTALHLALHKEAGLVTFHGPHPMDGMGTPEGMTERAEQAFWQALRAEENPASRPKGNAELRFEGLPKSLSPGVASGLLVGGNLALICALLNTPFEIETRDRVLFLEDTDEAPYRIDRYFAQLKLSGKLNELSAIVLGEFTHCDPPSGRPSLSLAEIFSDYLVELGIPVVTGFPAGHAADNVTFPLNVRCEVNADEKHVRILEAPCRPFH